MFYGAVTVGLLINESISSNLIGILSWFVSVIFEAEEMKCSQVPASQDLLLFSV